MISVIWNQFGYAIVAAPWKHLRSVAASQPRAPLTFRLEVDPHKSITTADTTRDRIGTIGKMLILNVTYIKETDADTPNVLLVPSPPSNLVRHQPGYHISW